MKKVFTIIISTILIGLIALGVIGYYVEKDDVAQAQKAEENVANSEEVKDEEDARLVLDVDKLDISQIEGYTPNQDISNDEVKTDDENLTAGEISLPYNITSKNMEIVSIGQYSGKFVEDGSDANKDNVLAMIIKNTSDEVIDYGEIKIKISGKSTTLKFIVTNLKPGASTLVMESTGDVQFNSEDKYVYVSSKSNMKKSLSLMEDKIEVTTKDKQITVKNLSDENLNTVYVYYKNITAGECYLGGTTYRAKFENVKSGKSATSNTIHFSNSKSEILKIESLSE